MRPGPTPMTVCPYPNNYDCACRCGAYCGAWNIDPRYPPDKCPHYQPVTHEIINRLETKLLNECGRCTRKNTRGSSDYCAISETCDIMVAYNQLEKIRNRYVKRGKD